MPTGLEKQAFEAAQDGNAARITALAEEGLDVPASSQLLQAAVANGSMETFFELLRLGADVNRADSAGYTALHVAAMKYEPTVVAAILGVGADKGLKTKEGKTACQVAEEAHASDLESAAMFAAMPIAPPGLLAARRAQEEAAKLARLEACIKLLED